MNIIIPIGGKGERFKTRYNVPKPCIPVFEKQMLSYVLDYLTVSAEDRIFIISYSEIPSIPSRHPYQRITIDKQTEGASETLLLGIEQIKRLTSLSKCMILDCDTFYTQDIVSIYRESDSNAVFYTINTESDPIYSYIRVDSQDRVLEIAEKKKISDLTNTGVYCFSSLNELETYAERVVSTNHRFNHEYYTSCIIDLMLQDKHEFVGIPLEPCYVFSLGTPRQLDAYLQQTYLFLFDLDGTLVITDDIYFDVWKQILKPYKITLTKELFVEYIQGKNDQMALYKLIPSIHTQEIARISALKDELFCQHLHQIKIIDGAIEFIRQIKSLGHKIAIVTNCNRSVAVKTLQSIGATDWIDCLVIGNECQRTKPYPDPYLRAIDYFNSNHQKAIIFEDSKTGIQSGRNTFPKCLVGVETNFSHDELVSKYGADISISSYTSLDISTLITHHNMNLNTIQEYIQNSLHSLTIERVEMFDHKLKGGYISDVIGVKIHTEERGVLDCVVKLENKNETFLSSMANQLGLYEREYYFYDYIYKYIPICYPECYGLVHDRQLNPIGILMKNLSNQSYELNLDLNSQPVHVSLTVLDRLAQLHAFFWNKNKFPNLKQHMDWTQFIRDKWPVFKHKWEFCLSDEQLRMGEQIVQEIGNIRSRLSSGHFTFCHGDVKSANIFYQPLPNGHYEPYFIDWQYIHYGKGVQDVVFFMIESFDLSTMKKYKVLFKEYYYIKLLEFGIVYSKEEYEQDFQDASRYFPFFVAMWFGTIDENDLIDTNFPFFFIQRLFHFLTIHDFE